MAGLNRICGDEFSTLVGIPPTGVVSRWNIAGCSAICHFRPECCSWVLVVLLSPDCSRVNLSVAVNSREYTTLVQHDRDCFTVRVAGHGWRIRCLSWSV